LGEEEGLMSSVVPSRTRIPEDRVVAYNMKRIWESVLYWRKIFCSTDQSSDAHQYLSQLKRFGEPLTEMSVLLDNQVLIKTRNDI